MREHGEPGTNMKTPVNDLNPHCDDDQHFSGDPRGDPRDDWMAGGGRGRRRAMMAMMMRDPSGMEYGMHHGQFGFEGRGGRGRGGWFGFGGRGGRGRGSWSGFGGRGRGFGGRCGGGRGRWSESSSSSSSSESDDEQHAPDDDVQGRQPHGEDPEKTDNPKDQTQQETTKSDSAEAEKDQPSSDQCCNHGYHGRRHGRGHHKHHHGKHMHHHHHHHHKMPYHHGHDGCYMPPFPPMHYPHHDVPHCHGNRRHMAKKFFKRSMKKWYKAEKKAWKQQQGDHCCNRVQRSDGEAVTSGCDNDDDIANTEIQGELPPPWFFFSHDHHGCGHGRRGFCRQGKKGKKHGERRRQCNCERPGPAEETNKKAATDNQVNVADEVEILDDDQTPMDDVTE